MRGKADLLHERKYWHTEQGTAGKQNLGIKFNLMPPFPSSTLKGQDPCGGIYKYAEVHYTCLAASPTCDEADLVETTFASKTLLPSGNYRYHVTP